jgi:hypothetical protein
MKLGQDALMPRQMRMENPGAIYHVMSRGDQREPVFLDEGCRPYFLKTLGDGWAPGGKQMNSHKWTKLWSDPSDPSEAGRIIICRSWCGPDISSGWASQQRTLASGLRLLKSSG